MYLLIPGRHQLLTQFQFQYIQRLIQNGLEKEQDVFGNTIGITPKIEAELFTLQHDQLVPFDYPVTTMFLIGVKDKAFS